ncbi:hypothetical protein SAMN04488057_102200 [Cyclobacterium lianum]|uniref:Uncharacterized protein n=1 Tax=Cyclobacterium lianum TaxID=388280 RepID=A0A1M7JXF5_9BACT|nr:hypothetical protein [Cyclobacterium lianum]SHM57668.1 hypothetical protein SAMN04488057_102200 [Cyclobacterium lianum]
MKKLLRFLFGLILISIFTLQAALAQCAMCRATIENNVSNGDTTVGAGLNLGILYLFVAPYILLSILGYLWYRHARKKRKLSFK